MLRFTNELGRCRGMTGTRAGRPGASPHAAARAGQVRPWRRGDDEDDGFEAAVLALALAVERHDRNTELHCARIAWHALATGAALGLSAGDCRILVFGGHLHDLGKIAISQRILLKPGVLTPDEERVMRLHPLIGDALCRRLPILGPVRPIVRWHHERLDGTGYPDGLRGDRIPLVAQITGIADLYDAITSARPYKAALPAGVACEVLADDVRKGWRRRDLVEVFIRIVEAGLAPGGSAAIRPSGCGSPENASHLPVPAAA